MTEGQYLVLWQVYRKVPKKGFWNLLLGKKMVKQEEVIQVFDTEEIAEHGFKNLKQNGCIKPLLLKVLKE